MEYTGGQLALNKGWEAYKVEAGAILAPDETHFAERAPISAKLPGSIHHSLQESGYRLDGADQYDWWYHLEFDATEGAAAKPLELCLDRLATFSKVWLNGELIGEHKSFFMPLRLAVTSLLKDKNHLYICFSSVHAFLNQRFPRPKWKTNLVNHQNLRWVRTSLLGRIPAWTPAQPAIGPCGEIFLREVECVTLLKSSVITNISNQKGAVEACIELSADCEGVQLSFGLHSVALTQVKDNQSDSFRYVAKLDIDQPKLWWPHTTGKPNLYSVSVSGSAGSNSFQFDLGKRGFKSLAFVEQNGLRCLVNNVPIFLRGGCWTVLDLERFWSSETDYRKVLIRLRDAGVNLIRVGGTMQYEQAEFYNLCDELGILVWQDFMFANMDYPVDDPEFAATIKSEVNYHVSRLANHACIAVYCGSSEVQQQAAMMGVSRESWSNSFFDEVIPEIIEENHKGIRYFPSSPCGGDLPFHLGEGITHFYGVGAYQMDLLGSGVDSVRFASESLGFSHIPESKAIEALFDGGLPMCHSPIWKAGVPRDNGAGLDFEDVRDHYLSQLFNVDAVKLRSQDTHHYLSLSRVISGELSKQVLGRWRDQHSLCGGALIWYLHDIVPGAGWGLLDNEGNPKAAYYQVSRALQPLSAFLLDKGLDGLDALVINESEAERVLDVEIKLISNNRTLIDSYQGSITIAAFSQWKAGVDGLLGLFRDLTFSYRFGSRQHEIVSLNVFEQASNVLVAEDVYFVNNMQLPQVADPVIDLGLVEIEGEPLLEITSDCFLQYVSFEFAKGVSAKDSYFHLIPNVKRQVRIDNFERSQEFVKGYLAALNINTPIRIRVQREASNEQ